LISEPGFAWERQVFGAVCFATYAKSSNESSSPYEITDIALDFYGTDKEDVISSAEQGWLQELLQGCKANVFITNVPPMLIYEQHKAKSIFKCRYRSCKSFKDMCIRY
jgi:hypothetical protein